MRASRWVVVLTAVAAAAVLASACGSGGPAAPPDAAPAALVGTATGSVLDGAGSAEGRGASIQVAAAADLRPALARMQPEIERQCGTRLTLVFGSSGQLAAQVQAGARFGLLLSADAQYPAALERAGLVVPNGRASYAVGRLALVTRPGLEAVADPRALAARPEIKTIAIANPEHAPYGRAAEQALRQAGVYEQVRARLVLGENVRQATDYVEQGNADAGIVAYALVVSGSPASSRLIDAALHLPIEQAGAVVGGTGVELTARCVLQYLLDPAGQAALRQAGFEAVRR